MAVKDSNRLRINLPAIFLLALAVLAVSTQILVLILKHVYGRFELSDILPTEKNLKLATSASRPLAAILHSKYTENLLLEQGAWLADKEHMLADNVNTWKRFMRDTRFQCDVIDDRVIESGLHGKYQLIILPGAKALSGSEIIQLKRYIENGGSILATSGTGSFSEDGTWRGWKFLEEVYGLRFTKEIAPDGQTKTLRLRGGQALSAGIPTGYSFKIATWDRPIACKVMEPRTTQAGSWSGARRETGLSGEKLDESAGIVFGKYGRGRFIWMGFELSSVLGEQQDHVLFDRFFDNSIHWLSHFPTVLVKDWPSTYSAAAMTFSFLSGNFSNVTNIFETVESEKIPITFFVDPEVAESQQETIRTLTKYGDLGAIADLGSLLPGEEQGLQLHDFKTQRRKLKHAKEKLEALAKVQIKGAAPFYGAYDENSVHALISTGYDYVIADHAADRMVPKTAIKGEHLIVGFTRSARDDYDVIAKYGLRDTSFQFDTYAEDIDETLFQGGLYALKIHPDYQCQPQFAAVFKNVVGYLREKNVWLTTAAEIKDWWAAKNALEVHSEIRGNRRLVLVLSNPGDWTIKNFVIQINLNRVVRNIEISSDIIGTTIPQYTHDPDMEVLQVSFASLQPGESFSYFIDFDNVEPAGAAEPSVTMQPDNSPPVITLFNPKTNDTISPGRNEIIYDASDDRGLAFFELYVNEKLASRYDLNSDGSKPALIWNVDTNLPDTKISYFVVAYDKAGNAKQSDIMTNIYVKSRFMAPATIRNLTLTKLSDGLVNLLWEDNSSDEWGFDIWRKQEDGSYQKIMSLPQNTVSVNDTGLFALVKYCYKVGAFSGSGYSESEEICTGPGLSNTPAAPTNLKAMASGPGSIRLTWTDNSSDELVFRIERKLFEENFYSRLALVPQNSTEYEDRQGLLAPANYTYRVAAQGQFGQSEWSNVAAVITSSQDISPPADLVAVFHAADKQVVLSWRHNSVIGSKTRLERKTGLSGRYFEIASIDFTASTYTDTSIEAGNEYYYRTVVVNADGQLSGYSNEVVVNTKL